MRWSDFLNVEMAGLTGGIFVLIWTVRRVASRFSSSWLKPIKKVAWKLAPAWPVGLGVAGAASFFPGDSMPLRIAKGMIAGFASQWGRTLIKRLVMEKLGIDVDFDATPPARSGRAGPPPVPPPVPPPSSSAQGEI